MNDAEHMKTYGVDGKVCEHVHHIAVIDVPILVIQKIEEDAGQEEAKNRQPCNKRVRPAVHHTDVVQGKKETGEHIGTAFAEGSSQLEIPKAPEEKLFQKGIYKGDIKGHQHKIIPVHHEILRNGPFNSL